MNALKAGALMRNLSLWILAFTFIGAWLPFIRCLFDGESYQWGQAYFGHMFSSKGVTGDFWVLIVHTALAWIILFAGFRRPGRLAYLLMISWASLNFADTARGVIADPETMMFYGDTLGVAVNIGYFAISVWGVALAGAVLGAMIELQPGAAPGPFGWTRTNSYLLGGAMAFLPVQYYFLSTGEPHATTDEIGVILTMVQWLAIIVAISIGRKPPG